MNGSRLISFQPIRSPGYTESRLRQTLPSQRDVTYDDDENENENISFCWNLIQLIPFIRHSNEHFPFSSSNIVNFPFTIEH